MAVRPPGLLLPSLARDARAAAGTRLQTSAIHTYTIRARMHRTSSRVLSRSLVGPSSARFLPRSQRARVEQLYSHSSRARRWRPHRVWAPHAHQRPPPLRVGSTEDGSAANVHKKRCNESRSSAEGGRDPLPLLSARQAFLHAHRRYLCFMVALLFVTNGIHAATLRAHSPLVRVSISYLLAVTDLC